jgi:hypothetical protein
MSEKPIVNNEFGLPILNSPSTVTAHHTAGRPLDAEFGFMSMMLRRFICNFVIN